MYVNSGDVKQQTIWPTAAQIKQRSAEKFSSLDLTPDADLSYVIRRAEERIGKPIRIEPVGNEKWETLTALLVETDDSANILIRHDDSEIYQNHCILHELAHIIYNHPGCRTAKATAPAMVHSDFSDKVRGRILALESGELTEVEGASAIIEGEAESLAYLLARRLLRPRHQADERIFG
ncbi:MAG: hypothetical protein J0I18_22145 [Actinobacteria bacterium]|nr:hypothetical protein [Actinomycetota bacterium]